MDYNMNSKGQIIGQVFIYIMAVVVIGVIILIGYSGIKSFLVRGCQVEQITFKQDILQYVESQSGYGNSQRFTLSAPCGYETVCFVDADRIGVTAPQISCNYGFIKKSAISGVQQNVFLISKDRVVPIGYSSKIKLGLPDTCACISSKNKNFYIKFEGEGQRTLISNG
jgi:hypothetical protein